MSKERIIPGMRLETAKRVALAGIVAVVVGPLAQITDVKSAVLPTPTQMSVPIMKKAK